MSDERLERIAKRLGDDAARHIDVTRVTDNVLSRLKDEPVRRPILSPMVWKVAAAIALVVGLGGVASRFPADRPVGAEYADLSDFTDVELAEMFDSLNVEQPVYAMVSGFDDFDESELRELLEAMEG